MTEDELVGWNHQLDGHEFVQVPGGGEDISGLYHSKVFLYFFVLIT